jgi:hypothetical protein
MDEDFPTILETDHFFTDPSLTEPFPKHADPPASVMPLSHMSILFHLQTAMRSRAVHGLATRGAWTPQEDVLLTTAVAQLGPRRWVAIAKFVQSRTPKQCRERWFDRIAPGIRREPFEPWEDAIIRESQGEMGNHWSRIAQRIPGRSSCAVKNRWYSGLRNQAPPHAQLEMEKRTPCPL